MKQTVQPDASHAKKTAEPTRSRPERQRTVAPTGHLGQLAEMLNGSSQVQAQAKLRDDVQHGARMQIAESMMAPLGESNTDAPTQLREMMVNGDATLNGESSQLEKDAVTPLKHNGVPRPSKADLDNSPAARHLLLPAQRTPVIQRAINTAVAYTDPVDASHQTKMTAVVQYLNHSLAGVNNGIVNLNINVKKMALTDPARTGRAGNDINVDLADWFVISASVGDITGMLAHEIGVHTLADAQQILGERSEEEQYQQHPFSVRVGLHTQTVTPWDDNQRQRGRQKDHVNVVRDKGNAGTPLRSIQGQPGVDNKNKSLAGTPFDFNSVNRRAEEYAATMLRLGDAIEAHATISRQEKDQRLHDLLNSFLFDYGRMLATNDLAWHVADKTPLVAQVFNWYKNVIIGRHGAGHAWLQRDTMLPTASTWGLRAYLLGRLTQSISAKVLPEVVHNAAGTVLNTGGRVLSGIGSAISSVTPDVVKQGGSLLASGAGKLLRGADYLYGEAENLVLPNVVAPLAWAGGKAAAGIGWLGGAVGNWLKPKRA